MLRIDLAFPDASSSPQPIRMNMVSFVLMQTGDRRKAARWLIPTR